ncbi:MAG: hypothetical protein IT429_24865 [Gemmataceae bacterium]|nr:hypothetical protein [Gemmataceae bacterium]
MRMDVPPVGRLLFLLPDLWPEADRAAFEAPASREALEALVERRTGVRPVIAPPRIWAITVPVPDTVLTMSEEAQAAFLERHESRPLEPD